MGRSNHNIHPLQGQRGIAAILFVLCLPVLLGFSTLAFDLARLSLTRVELQNAADAAAFAGALALNDTQPPPGPTDHPYHWSAASASALEVARCNNANGAPIQDALVETGYWNLNNPALGLRAVGTPGVPAAGDLPAIRVTISISGTKNNGPLQLFFAPILGIADREIQSSATVVLPVPEGGTGIFPIVLNKSMFDHYWDSSKRQPRLDHETGKAYVIDIGTTRFGGNLTGSWSTFTEHYNDTPSVEHLIEHGNATNLSIGMNTWIPTGVKEAVFKSVPSNKDVAVLVVENVQEGSSQPVYAIAAFHIVGTVKHDGKSYIRGNFIENALISTTTPGAGNGVPLGASSSPIQVQ